MRSTDRRGGVKPREKEKIQRTDSELSTETAFSVEGRHSAFTL